MCDICVMEAVKEKMLSRRDFFKVGAASAAAITATSSSVTQATTPSTEKAAKTNSTEAMEPIR